MKKNILTIATGKAYFISMAANLARSFFYWHPDSDINFQIVTDNADLFPADLRSKVNFIQIRPGELGEGFSTKLNLDRVSTDGQTLFIDSDCLIFGDLNFLFDRFKGHQVSVVGVGYVKDGEWFGNVREVCSKFNVPHLPQFNGGIYYLEKGPKATLVYEKARELEKSYDEIGFVRLRGRPNDEVLMALSMQLNNERPIEDDGTIMSDPQACPGGYSIDVISGKRSLYNPPSPHPLNQSWNPFERVSPAVFHFLGSYTENYPYKRETARLDKKMAGKLNWFTNLIIILKIEFPERFKNAFKTIFRSLYHSIFGTRKVKKSSRL